MLADVRCDGAHDQTEHHHRSRPGGQGGRVLAHGERHGVGESGRPMCRAGRGPPRCRSRGRVASAARAPPRRGGRPRRRTAAAPTSGVTTRRAAASTNRTARVQLSQDSEVVSPTALSTYSTARQAAARAPQVRALAESWQVSAATPVPTSPMPTHDAPKASRALGRETADHGREAAEHADHQRHHEPLGHRGNEQGVTPDGRPTEELRAPGLLLHPRVPAYDDHGQDRDEHGVEHGHLGHRQLADAAHVEDRAVERHHCGAGVDRLGGGHAVGLGRVQRRGGRRRGVADRDQHEHPDEHQEPVASHAEARQLADTADGAHDDGSR